MGNRSYIGVWSSCSVGNADIGRVRPVQVLSAMVSVDGWLFPLRRGSRWLHLRSNAVVRDTARMCVTNWSWTIHLCNHTTIG